MFCWVGVTAGLGRRILHRWTPDSNRKGVQVQGMDFLGFIWSTVFVVSSRKRLTRFYNAECKLYIGIPGSLHLWGKSHSLNP